MVSGDRADVAESVGVVLGVDTVLSECSPADKVDAVVAEQACGSTVMVGDGINDAPALARADVGVAMGASGVTASSEAADVVLTIDRLDRLAEAMAVARRAGRIARQSVLVGIGMSTGCDGRRRSRFPSALRGCLGARGHRCRGDPQRIACPGRRPDAPTHRGGRCRAGATIRHRTRQPAAGTRPAAAGSRWARDATRRRGDRRRACGPSLPRRRAGTARGRRGQPALPGSRPSPWRRRDDRDHEPRPCRDRPPHPAAGAGARGDRRRTARRQPTCGSCADSCTGCTRSSGLHFAQEEEGYFSLLDEPVDHASSRRSHPTLRWGLTALATSEQTE